MILFLDYDGVLHPDAVYLDRGGNPVLRAEGGLFMWAGLLMEALAEHPSVQIVLSTSWARRLPYVQVRGYLATGLRERVIGSTWHQVRSVPGYNKGLPFSYWQDATRYQQIRRWVDHYRLDEWCAVDDDAEGWSESDRSSLIQTQGATGLSEPGVLVRLSELLEGAHDPR